MDASVLEQYLAQSQNPLEQYPQALRKKAPAAKRFPAYAGQGMDLTSGIADPMGTPPPAPPPVQPQQQQPSLAPGVAPQAPQGQVGDRYWDDNFMASKLGMDALAGEDQGLQDQAALIDSLRGGKHKTAVGGAIGAATDMVATLAALKNQDKRSNVRERSLDEMRKSLFRNSATGGMEVDPTRDF